MTGWSEIAETTDDYIERSRAFDPFWPMMLEIFDPSNDAEISLMMRLIMAGTGGQDAEA